MRVLIYADFRFWGGAPLALLRLARGLSRQGLKILIMGRMNRQINALLNRDPRIESVIPVKKNNLGAALAALSAAKAGSVDLVLGSSLRPGLGCVTAASALRRPLLWRMMGDPKNLSATNRTYSSSEVNKIIRFIGRASDKIITVCDYLNNLFAAQGFKARTIYNGCDTRLFKPNARQRASFRKKLRLRPDDTAIGLIANFHPHKNQQTLIRAISCMRDKKRRFKAYLMGGAFEPKMTTHLNNIKKLIHRHRLQEWVVFLDFQKDMVPLYNALDIAVFPFLDEGGCSNALLESMACQKAVIVNTSGSFPEMIRQGKEGVLLAPNDSEALAAKILWLMENQKAARAMGIRARKRVLRQFSVERMVLNYKKVLSQFQRNSEKY
jgi:glycosyltransferase involved in cell wall biosynthesis